MSPLPGFFASEIQGHLYAPAGAYDSLAAITVPSAGVTSVSFTNIPSTYKHLQIRWTAATNDGNFNALIIRYNTDTGANYSWHAVYGSGTGSGTVEYNTSDTNIRTIGTAGTAQSGIYNAAIYDILDYSNTTKYKSCRILSGTDANGSGYAILSSGLWFNSTAISTVTIAPITSGGLLTSNSQFALYGVK
jgi:hypothetical protein